MSAVISQELKDLINQFQKDLLKLNNPIFDLSIEFHTSHQKIRTFESLVKSFPVETTINIKITQKHGTNIWI